MSKRWRNAALILYVAALLWWFRRELPLLEPDARGRVESVGAMRWPYEGIRCAIGSQRDAESPELNLPALYAGMTSGTQIWDYSGGSGDVRVGQTLSMWFNGKASTYPPHVYPHSVVIEPPIWMHFVVFGLLTISLFLGLGGLAWFRRIQKWHGAPHD